MKIVFFFLAAKNSRQNVVSGNPITRTHTIYKVAQAHTKNTNSHNIALFILTRFDLSVKYFIAYALLDEDKKLWQTKG